MALQADGTYCGGWGQEWGSIPWGGVQCGPPQPSGPTGGWVGGARYERISRRYEREEREEHLVRNVIFTVSGLHAKLKLGKARVGTGTGTRVKARHLAAIHAALGLVEVRADSAVPSFFIAPGIASERGEIAASADSQALAITAPGLRLESGEPEVNASSAVSVRAPRNLSTDELLMMLAELL